MLYLMEKHWLFMTMAKKLLHLLGCPASPDINLQNIKIKQILGRFHKEHMLREKKIFKIEMIMAL